MLTSEGWCLAAGQLHIWCFYFIIIFLVPLPLSVSHHLSVCDSTGIGYDIAQGKVSDSRPGSAFPGLGTWTVFGRRGPGWPLLLPSMPGHHGGGVSEGVARPLLCQHYRQLHRQWGQVVPRAG